MTAISLSSNAEIQSWELNHQNADLTVNGVTLVGNEAAAYLFGLALSSVDLSAFGSMGQDRFNRNDAVLDFPPGSGQRVSLTEISDALRYKYSIDPLVEFSSSVGLAGYSLADVNSVLQALNTEYKGRFEHPLLSRSEGGAETVYITQETPAAALSDMLTAQARQALADLVTQVRSAVLASSTLQRKLNPLQGIGLSESVFPGAASGSTVSFQQLIDDFNAAIGGDLKTLMPDLFADDRLNFGDLNTLLAAAREALPSRAREWDDLSLALLTVTQGSQTFTGRQALAMSTAQTLATLDIAQRTGPNLREAPVFGLDDAVFTNPLISGQKISLRQLVERMRQNTGYDPLAHLQPLPQQWRINDVNALIDGINQALQPTTTVSLVSFNFVNADGLTLTAQQAYAYSLLKTLNSAGTSSALASVWSDYSSAANGTSSTYDGSTVNLSSLQAFNTAVSGNTAWTLPNAWTLSGSTRALTGESPLLSQGANSPSVFLSKTQALAVLNTLPVTSIVYGADENGDVWQMAKQLSGTITERNYGAAGTFRNRLADQWGVELEPFVPGYAVSAPDPGLRAGLNIRTSSPEVLKVGMTMLAQYGNIPGQAAMQILNEFPYPGPAVQYGFFGLTFNPNFTPNSFNPPYQLAQAQSLDAKLFEFPAGSGERLNLRELSAVLAQDFGGSAAAGAHNGALSLEDWFMGYGTSYSGQDSTGYPSGYANVFAAAGEYFNANGGTSSGPQVVGVGTFSDPTKATPVTEWSIKAAMLGLYWANPATSTDDYITPVVANSYQLGAVASAAKTASTLVSGVNANHASLTGTYTAYTSLTLDKLRANLTATVSAPVYLDDLAELRRQVGALSTWQATGLSLGSSSAVVQGSFHVATALMSGVLGDSDILARLQFGSAIGLDEAIWPDQPAQFMSLRELMSQAGILSPVLQALPSLGTQGLDYEGLHKLLVTARQLNPGKVDALDFVQPWFQPYSQAGQSFEGGNALLLRVADSLFAQLANQAYKNNALASQARVFVDPTDTTGVSRLSLDDYSLLLSRLLGVDPVRKRATWYAQDIEQLIKDLYAAVQPAISAPGRTSSAAITSADLVVFINGLTPAAGASFGPDTFDAHARLFSRTVGGATVTRSLSDLLQEFSTQKGLDLAPRLREMGILRDADTVQLRGLNALGDWVRSQQSGSISAVALPVSGSPMAVDATVDYAAILRSTDEDAWGLTALQALMAEWAQVPDPNRLTEWPRWQLRYQSWLSDLDNSVGGLNGLGLDAPTQLALRSLATATVAPELFAQGNNIQLWLNTLQTRLMALLSQVNQDIRNLTSTQVSASYTAVRNDIAQRLLVLQQQATQIQEATAITSQLRAAGTTLGVFQAALAGAQTVERPNVLAWLARFDIPQSDLTNTSYTVRTGGLDAFDLARWTSQAPAATITAEQTLADLSTAETYWQTTAVAWNTWFERMQTTSLPALQASLASDLQLQKAYLAADPGTAVYIQNIRDIEARQLRITALLAALPSLKTAVLSSPDAFRAELQVQQSRLGVSDILLELSRYDVRPTDLSNPNSTMPAVNYFNVDQFWNVDLASAGNFTEAAIKTTHGDWRAATKPVMTWLDTARTQLQATLTVIDAAITRLTARWDEPATSINDRTALTTAIDSLRAARTLQMQRIGMAENLWADKDDAVLLNTALTNAQAQAVTQGKVLQFLAQGCLKPADISGAGPHVQTIAGVSVPNLSAASAAASVPYASDSVLTNAWTALNVSTPPALDWRVWLTQLSGRMANVVTDLSNNAGKLQLQRTLSGNSAADNGVIDSALWKVQGRLALFSQVKASVDKLVALKNKPEQFATHFDLEMASLARFADDMPSGQAGIVDGLQFLRYFDVDSMALLNSRATVAATAQRFDHAAWLSTYPNGSSPRDVGLLSADFSKWDARTDYQKWLISVTASVNGATQALQADRVRLTQAMVTEGNDDAHINARLEIVNKDLLLLAKARSALSTLAAAPITATGLASAITAAKKAADLLANADLFVWLSQFDVPTASLSAPAFRSGTAAISTFDGQAWLLDQTAPAPFSDAQINTSNPADWSVALSSVKARAAVVETAITEAQNRQGWSSTQAANTAIQTAMAASALTRSAVSSTLTQAVAKADRVQSIYTHALRGSSVDAAGRLRNRPVDMGDDGRFYHDSQAILLRVGRMLATLPPELSSVTYSQAVFTDPMWGNRRMSLDEITALCRETMGFDPLALADGSSQRPAWTRAELNFVLAGINQQLRADPSHPVLSSTGVAAEVIVSSVAPPAGQPAAQINLNTYQALLHQRLLDSDLSQTVVESDLRDGLVEVMNAVSQLDGGDFVLSDGAISASLTAATQTLTNLGMPLSDPARRLELKNALGSLVDLLDANATLSGSLNQVQRNLLLQQQLAALNTQWGVTDFLSRITAGRLTSANLSGLAELRTYLTETKTSAENLRTFYDARFNEARDRKTAYENISPSYSFLATDATRNTNVLANLERGLAALQATYDANTWPTYYMVAVFHTGALQNTGNANTVHWDQVSSWANKLGIETSNYLTKDLVTANNAPLTQAQWKATMVALQQVIGSMRIGMGQFSGDKFDRLESVYASLRDQGFLANFGQQVNSFGYSLSPSDPTASTTQNLRPAAERIDNADLTTLALGLFGLDSRIKVAIDAGSSCTQAQWNAAMQEYRDLLDLLPSRNQLQKAWETEQALEHAAYHSREEITGGLSAMTSLITAANTSATAFQTALTTVGTAQQAWRNGQDVMSWLRTYDVDPALLTYGSQSNLTTSYQQYASTSSLDPTSGNWSSNAVNWSSVGLGVSATLPLGSSGAIDTSALAQKAAIEAELRGDYHYFDWNRWKLGAVDEGDLASMNRADAARMYQQLTDTQISTDRLKTYYTDRLNEAQDRVAAFQKISPSYDFSDPALNTGRLALLDSLITDMTSRSTAVPYAGPEFKDFVYTRVLAAPNSNTAWYIAPARAININEQMFRNWSDNTFGKDSQLSKMLWSEYYYPTKTEFDQALAQIEQLRGQLRAAVYANTGDPANLQSVIDGLNLYISPWQNWGSIRIRDSSTLFWSDSRYLLEMAVGLYGDNSKIKQYWSPQSVTQSQWVEAVREVKDIQAYLAGLRQLGGARTQAQQDVATAQAALTDITDARTRIGTLTAATYAVAATTAGSAAETTALTAVRTAFTAVPTPNDQDVLAWLRNYQVSASSLTYTDPNRLTISYNNYPSANSAVSTAATASTWVSWDDLRLGVAASLRPAGSAAAQTTFRLAQLAAIQAQVDNQFTSFNWTSWKTSVAASTPATGTALQGASTGYTNTSAQAVAVRDLSSDSWTLMRSAGAAAKAAAETLLAPEVLVVPDGVADITLRNIDEPAALAAYTGLVAKVSERDAVQSAVDSLIDTMQSNAALSTAEQIDRLRTSLTDLQTSMGVNDLLSEMTQGVYSIDSLTGSMDGIQTYLTTVKTNATGLSTFLGARATEAQQRVTAYAKTAGAYDTSMQVGSNGLVVPSNDAVGQALSQLYASLKTRIAGNAVSTNGFNLVAAINQDGVYAPGQLNTSRYRDIPLLPNTLKTWCETKYGSNSSFKQLIDLNATTYTPSLAQAALDELKGVLFDGGYRNPALASDPNTLRANQLDDLATAMAGSSGNLRNVVVLGTHGFDAATLSTWATNLFGPNSKLKAAFDANGTTSGTNWTNAREEVSQMARDIRVTQLASNGAFIDQLQSTMTGLTALYNAQDWFSYTTTEDRLLGTNWPNGYTTYDFTENLRNFNADWLSLNTGSTAISRDTASLLSQWLSIPASAGLIKAALDGTSNDNSASYGNALKELNELLVQIKQRSNLLPAVYSARQALADAQQPQTEVALAITTLNSLSTATTSGTSALAAAITAAKTSATVTAYRGTADLFEWLRKFDVPASVLWQKPLTASLTWEENYYTASNYVVPVDASYQGTWPNLTKYDKQVVMLSLQYLNPVSVSYTETIPLNATLASGTWTPDWAGTGLDSNSSPSFTWGLLSHGSGQYIGVTPWRTRLASLYKAEASGQYDSFSWRQWKAGAAQNSSGAYLDAYAQASTARQDQAVLNSAGLGPTDLAAIQGRLITLKALLSQCKSLADVITAMQGESGIDIMGLLKQLGIVVDDQYASRDGLNKLLEVLRNEMPERVTATPVAAVSGSVESTRSITLDEFKTAISTAQQRENALQKLQEHLDSWKNYNTLYERRTHWTQWLADLQVLANTSRAHVGDLGLDLNALIATLQADTRYTQAAANTLDSYVPHLTFFTQVRWRTEQLLDHWNTLWDTLATKRKDYVAYTLEEDTSTPPQLLNSATNIAAAQVQIDAIDALQAKIEVQRQLTVQANEAANHFLSIVPPSDTPAAITGDKLELLQQAVADFKQKINGQDVMAYLHDFSVPLSAWQNHNNTSTKDLYTVATVGTVTGISGSVFNFEKWRSTTNPQGAAATSLSGSDTTTDQFAYVTGLLTSASKTDTSLLSLGKIPSEATWLEVTQKTATARIAARSALLQAQAQLKLEYADIGDALSNLRKVSVPGGYDGYWYQMALALQSLQPNDLPAAGVTATAAVLEYPPGSGEQVSLKTLLDNLQTQAAADPQRAALAQKLLEILQDDPTAKLGTSATIVDQANLLDTGLTNRFEGTTNYANFAGALTTAFGASISNEQIRTWGVSLFGVDSQLAAAVLAGSTTLTSTQWKAAARELRLIQQDLERGYAGAIYGQTLAVRTMAAQAMMLSEGLTKLEADTAHYSYSGTMFGLFYYSDGHLWQDGHELPYAFNAMQVNAWGLKLFGKESALASAINKGDVTLTSAEWTAANAELRLIQEDIAKGEGGVLYGNKQAKLAALVQEASQGGDPLAVLTNGVFSLRDLSVDGTTALKNSLIYSDNLTRLEGFLQGTLLGDAQRVKVAQQVQAVFTPDAATDGLDGALTLKLQSALASLRNTYNDHDWKTTSTKNMVTALNALFTTDELERLRADAVALRAGSRALYQFGGYRSRLELAIGGGATAEKASWMLALSDLEWVLAARTFKAADQLLKEMDKPAGVDDWLLAATQGQVSDADLSIAAFAKGADSSDLLVKLYMNATTQYDAMSETSSVNFANDLLYANINYGLDTELHWSPNKLSEYRISFDELSALGTTYAGPGSMLAYAVSKDNQPIQGYHWGPVLTKTQMAEVLKELEAIIVGGLRQKQVNATLTRALEDVVNNTELPDAPVNLASVFAGVVDLNTLDWAKRQTLLSAIRQALPSVDTALQAWAEPEPDNAGQRMAKTVATRIREWKDAYDENARRTFMATATSLELRDSLTQGADIYVDRNGTYYIDGMRTRAMDVAVMTRAVAHTSFAEEYKVLMDAMSERNAMITAGNSYVNNVDTVTTTVTTSNSLLAQAANALKTTLQTMGASGWSSGTSSTNTLSSTDKASIKATLTTWATNTGSDDILFDISFGRYSMKNFDDITWKGGMANGLYADGLDNFIKFDKLVGPLRSQTNNVKSGDILSEMTGGRFVLDPSKVKLAGSAEMLYNVLGWQVDATTPTANQKTTFYNSLLQENTRNGGVDVLSLCTDGAYTTANFSSSGTTAWNATTRTALLTALGLYHNRSSDRPAYFEDDLSELTNLLNTLISNKVRDNDLDQGKLQSITSQIQINTEAMTALIKAFSELNSALAQALK
jgi:hypothetical protein